MMFDNVDKNDCIETNTKINARIFETRAFEQGANEDSKYCLVTIDSKICLVTTKIAKKKHHCCIGYADVKICYTCVPKHINEGLCR
jgi:hypothetical protein